MGKRKTFIARHILEIRHIKKSFNFLDYHGELVDHLLEATGFNKIKVDKSGARVEVVSETLDKTFFLSFENFGLQIEAAADFDIFRKEVTKLLKIIEDFPRYTYREVLRIGTKSTIFCNVPSRPEEGLRQLFFNNLFANKSVFEDKTGLKVTDIAQLYLDTKNDDIKTIITTGPANLDEVVDKFFVKPRLYSVFGKKSGVFYEIDAFTETAKNIKFSELEKQVEKQIDIIEKSFNGYMSMFNEKTK